MISLKPYVIFLIYWFHTLMYHIAIILFLFNNPGLLRREGNKETQIWYPSNLCKFSGIDFTHQCTTLGLPFFLSCLITLAFRDRKETKLHIWYPLNPMWFPWYSTHTPMYHIGVPFFFSSFIILAFEMRSKQWHINWYPLHPMWFFWYLFYTPMYHIGGGILLVLEHKHAMNCVCTVWWQCLFFWKFLRKLFSRTSYRRGGICNAKLVVVSAFK